MAWPSAERTYLHLFLSLTYFVCAQLIRSTLLSERPSFWCMIPHLVLIRDRFMCITQRCIQLSLLLSHINVVDVVVWRVLWGNFGKMVISCEPTSVLTQILSPSLTTVPASPSTVWCWVFYLIEFEGTYVKRSDVFLVRTEERAAGYWRSELSLKSDMSDLT